jgi:hypothetical protein
MVFARSADRRARMPDDQMPEPNNLQGDYGAPPSATAHLQHIRCRILGPIANVPAKEAEARSYAEIDTLAMAE